MSKSVGNYVALEDAPEDMFGKLMSISDALMLRYYELLTTEDLGRVKALHPMEAKQSLAGQIVTRYHGEEAGRKGRAAFQQKFQEKEFPAEPDATVTLTNADIKDREAPAIGIVDLVAKTGLVASKSEARRLVVQGGIEVDDQRQQDPNTMIALASGRHYRLRIGRRKFALVIFKV